MYIYIEDQQVGKRGWVAIEQTVNKFGKPIGYTAYVNRKKPSPVLLGESIKEGTTAGSKARLFKTFYQAYSAAVKHIYTRF